MAKTHKEAYEDLSAHASECKECNAGGAVNDRAKLCEIGGELWDEYIAAKKREGEERGESGAATSGTPSVSSGGSLPTAYDSDR
jgi:hypothetical protein